MIIDSCIFFGEMDMLKFRMDILSPLVDLFIVVENDVTHQGEPLPWVLEHHNFPKVRAHRAHVHSQVPFEIEVGQSNAIGEVMRDLADDDLFIFGGVDEIPSREAIQAFKDNPGETPRRCNLDFFYYRCNWKRPETCSCYLARVADVRRESVYAFREHRGDYRPVLPCNSGWHLSYFGGTEAMQRKVKSFIHNELNRPEFMDPVWLEKCQKEGIGLFKCGTPFERVAPNYFPDYFRELAPKEWWL